MHTYFALGANKIIFFVQILNNGGADQQNYFYERVLCTRVVRLVTFCVLLALSTYFFFIVVHKRNSRSPHTHTQLTQTSVVVNTYGGDFGILFFLIFFLYFCVLCGQ